MHLAQRVASDFDDLLELFDDLLRSQPLWVSPMLLARMPPDQRAIYTIGGHTHWTGRPTLEGARGAWKRLRVAYMRFKWWPRGYTPSLSRWPGPG